MTVAHIAGVPFEEWLLPLAATAGGLAAMLRARFSHDAGRRRPTQ